MFNSAYAWWYLTDDQKEELERQRRAGRTEFGGMGDKAPYLYAQEGSMLLGGAPAKAAIDAGIEPKLFIQRALEEGRLTSAAISDILSS